MKKMIILFFGLLSLPLFAQNYYQNNTPSETLYEASVLLITTVEINSNLIVPINSVFFEEQLSGAEGSIPHTIHPATKALTFEEFQENLKNIRLDIKQEEESIPQSNKVNNNKN